MKNIFLLLVSMIVGCGITIGILTYIGGKKVDEPKKDNVPLSTKFSIETPPSQSLKGNVVSLTGDVAWQSRIASQPAEITSLTTVQQGEEIVTGENGILQIWFASTCEIMMNPHTHLNFVQTLPQSLVIQQKTGEVSYTKKCSSPLSVRALHLLIDIKDGESMVTVNDTTVIIEVGTGEATIAYNDDENISQVVSIKDNETLTFEDNTRKVNIE